MNPPELTILTADTDAACDPETGTCTISQTPISSPGVAPVNRRSPSGHGGDPKALHPRTLEEAISQLNGLRREACRSVTCGSPGYAQSA